MANSFLTSIHFRGSASGKDVKGTKVKSSVRVRDVKGSKVRGSVSVRDIRGDRDAREVEYVPPIVGRKI